MDGGMLGRTQKGRPRQTILDNILNGSRYDILKRRAQFRKQWKKEVNRQMRLNRTR